ncbi:mitochondrial potassium channel-like [Prorops nasuta]|uniref:mitochondrial potassium channel-like n=1 Tax=Prorops nasuta TaxID=863751 RepID=UPI0034CFDCDA
MSHYQKLFKAVSDQIYKIRGLNNATAVIGSATEKAQEKLLYLQGVANEKYNTVVKKVNGSVIIQDMNAARLQPTPLPSHIVHWWNWYQQLTGLDAVEAARQQVIVVQDKLFNCQNERRNYHQQSTLINNKLKDVYAELVQTPRDDPKYVHLTIMENKGLQEQKKLSDKLNLLENEERDHFTQLSTAIKEYHDSQILNAQKYKYISIVASISLAIVSLIGSMIYNNRRISHIKKSIWEAQQQNENFFSKELSEIKSALSTTLLPRLPINVMEKQSQTEEEMPFDSFQTYVNDNFVFIGCTLLVVYIVAKIFQ